MSQEKKIGDNSKTKITKWNVNSIRKHVKYIKVIIQKFSSTILTLQKTKVNDNLFIGHIFNKCGYFFTRYNGETTVDNVIAILAKNDLQILPKLTYIKEVRNLAVRIKDNIGLYNFYVPAGGDIYNHSVNDKFKHKLLVLLDQLIDSFKVNTSSNDNIILMVYLNIDPLEDNVYSHKQLFKIVNHTIIGVERLGKLRNCLNFKDAVRNFTLDSAKLCSWVTYRARNLQKFNKRRQLNHVWITEPLYKHVLQAEISEYTRSLKVSYDHTPVGIITSTESL